MQQALGGNAGPSHGPMRPAKQAVWNLEEESRQSGGRPGRELTASVPSLPRKGPRGKRWGTKLKNQPRAPSGQRCGP